MEHLTVGDKVKFCSEKQRYTLQARNERFFILTKPFNAKKTYLYTIVDNERVIRGPCNLIFGLPEHCNTPEGAEVCLNWLDGFTDEYGQYNYMEVSGRKNRRLTEAERETFAGLHADA
jgi:hypothetical protein